MMNDYKVGSIADLISQSKGIKLISNKKKRANEQKSPGGKSGVTNTDDRLTKRRKSELKAKKTLKEIFHKADKPVKNSNDTSLTNKNVISEKKRKNSDSTSIESKNASKKKKKKSTDESKKCFQREFQGEDKKPPMGIDLNFVPSDSEDDENNSINKTANAKPQISSQKKKYKTFTECTIFVGNIPINYDKKKVQKIFSKFGSIQSTRIRCIPVADINISKKVAAIKKQFNAKRNSLVAYVQYKTQDSANAALKANGMVVDGHHLRVDLAEGSKENDNRKAVFIGGLPFDIEDDELWEFFQNCGKINSVRVVRDSQTSMGKGFGYVNFDSTAAVELALQMNGQELKKRTINVKRCVKARNKNKLNAFGRKKSKEVTDQLLCKKGKKFKEERKKKQKNKSPQVPAGNFQGKKASVKEKKKKKKLSQAALRQRKLVKILAASK